MHQLGDQWIELIDGEEHMVKAVNSTYNCNGCAYLCDNGKCLHESIIECPVFRIDAVIKDLGVLRDGLLPCPFCGEYPTIKLGQDSDGWSYVELACGNYLHRMTGYLSDLESFKQQAIEAWNRRV